MSKENKIIGCFYDLYRDPLYQQNKELISERNDLREELMELRAKQQPFVDALKNPDSIKIVYNGQYCTLELKITDSEFDNFKIYCKNVIYEVEKEY